MGLVLGGLGAWRAYCLAGLVPGGISRPKNLRDFLFGLSASSALYICTQVMYMHMHLHMYRETGDVPQGKPRHP